MCPVATGKVNNKLNYKPWMTSGLKTPAKETLTVPIFSLI